MPERCLALVGPCVRRVDTRSWQSSQTRRILSYFETVTCNGQAARPISATDTHAWTGQACRAPTRHHPSCSGSGPPFARRERLCLERSACPALRDPFYGRLAPSPIEHVSPVRQASLRLPLGVRNAQIVSKDRISQAQGRARAWRADLDRIKQDMVRLGARGASLVFPRNAGAGPVVPHARPRPSRTRRGPLAASRATIGPNSAVPGILAAPCAGRPLPAPTPAPSGPCRPTRRAPFGSA